MGIAYFARCAWQVSGQLRCLQFSIAGGLRRARSPGLGALLLFNGFTLQPTYCLHHPTDQQWGVHAGRSWELIEGLDGGQTQVDAPLDGEMAVWAHPVDVHFVCRGLSGWPKLHLQIWTQDIHGRNELRELPVHACC